MSDIKSIGRLSLRLANYIGGKIANKDEIEIVEWDEDRSMCWTIAQFEYDERHHDYYIKSIGERLDDARIDWLAFGQLVYYAYAYLRKMFDEKG